MKRTIIILSFFLIVFGITGCNNSNEITTTAEKVNNNQKYIMTPEKLTTEEYTITSALLDNVHKFSFVVPEEDTVNITVFCKYYHDGELVEEEKLSSSGEEGDSTVNIFIATTGQSRAIMSIKKNNTNKRLVYAPDVNIDLFEYTALYEKTGIENGKEIRLLTLRGPEKNPNEDSLHEETKYTDMMYITVRFDF